MASSSSPHVALLAFPFASHPNTLHALATVLASSAPQAAFSFLSSHRSRAALAKLPSPANLSLYHVSDGCEHVSLAQWRQKEVDVAKLFIEALQVNYMEGMRTAVSERGSAPITSILCDVLISPLVAVMAEKMGVPWVAFRTGGTSTLSAYIYADEIFSRTGDGKEGQQKLDFISSLSGFQVSDLPEALIDVENRQTTYWRLMQDMSIQISRAAAVVVNTSAVLEGPIVADFSTKFSRCLPIGPLNLLLPRHQTNPEACDPARCLSWLDDQLPSSVVYIAFGTTFTPEEEELRATAEALETTGIPFLWSLNEAAQLKLPSGFLDRAGGLVVHWSPQVEVLRHPAVGAFLTHCGWKSVLESVVEGVPMICRPLFGDQRMNARQVVDLWGIGLWVKSIDRDGLAAVLRRMLEEEEGRVMREKARLLGEKAREATAEGGSSRQSLKDLVGLLCCMETGFSPVSPLTAGPPVSLKDLVVQY